MSELVPFSITTHARWPDMDFNQHMRNAAFLGASEDCRMRFLAARGFPMAELVAERIGPVVLEDHLSYRGEIGLLEEFRVELALAAITEDGRRMRVRNTFVRPTDEKTLAVVESVVLWLDLAARRPVAPPEALRAAWLSLARTEDFEVHQPGDLLPR